MMIPLILGITIITFVVIHLAPGTPTDIQTQMNPKVSAEARDKLKRIYGLDKPLYKQYLDWLRRLVQMDFGHSFVDGRAVVEKIRDSLPITIIINLSAINRSNYIPSSQLLITCCSCRNFIYVNSPLLICYSKIILEMRIMFKIIILPPK